MIRSCFLFLAFLLFSTFAAADPPDAGPDTAVCEMPDAAPEIANDAPSDALDAVVPRAAARLPQNLGDVMNLPPPLRSKTRGRSWESADQLTVSPVIRIRCPRQLE